MKIQVHKQSHRVNQKNSRLRLGLSGSILSFILQFCGCTPSIADSPSVTELVLVNAATNKDIRVLKDGDEINLATLESRKLNIRASVSGTGVREVVFGLDKDKRYRSETSAPYSLAGDKGGKYLPWTPRIGPHILAVRVNPPRKTGIESAYVLKFTVVDDARSKPSPVVPTPTIPPLPTETPDTLDRAALNSRVIESVAEATPTAQASPIARTFPMRINCGGTALTTQDGKVWESDVDFTVAAKFGNGSQTDDPLGIAVFQSGRDSSLKPLEYHVPVPNGVYTVTLHFMELYIAAPEKRVFDVIAEGQSILQDIDVAASVGPYKPYSVVRSFIVTDGTLDLHFEAKIGFAMVSGIEIDKVASF